MFACETSRLTDDGKGTDAASSMRPQPCFNEGGGSIGHPSDSKPLSA